jgi:hypothetical protein
VATLVLLTTISWTWPSEPARQPDPIKDCPAGLRCFTADEYYVLAKGYANAIAGLAERDLEIKRLRLTQPKAFGWAIVCGATLYPDVSGPSIEPAVSVGCTWGWGIKNPHWPRGAK